MIIETSLGNYYGEVKFEDKGDECVMTLENWDCTQGIVISREFFNAAVKEFGGNNANTP